MSVQIFLSHSSRQKPLVREIIKYFPSHLSAWIDEEKLLFGDSIPKSLESTIKQDTDYVLLFIDRSAAESNWVFKEIDWAMQAEKLLDRTILLPIIVDDDAIEKMVSNVVQDRKHLRLSNFHEGSVKLLAESIVSNLFALVCRDMQQLRNPKPKVTTLVDAISNADEILRTQASIIQKAIFPHRRSKLYVRLVKFL
jgi:hypothetical protein